jgi:predicted DNA-binding transcriptional regulator AlpA
MQPQENLIFPTPASDPSGPFQDLMTEADLIRFLRIPEISTAKDHHNVILRLIRFRDLPRIHIGKRILFPKKAILEWVDQETKK